VRPSALVLAALIALATPTAASAEKLPVPWTAGEGIQAQAVQADAPPAGANDWDCDLTRRHRNPVVLVHGLTANRTTNWSTMSPFLANRGYCVYALTYGMRDSVDLGFYQPGGMKRMQQSARELKRFVARVLDATGARKVDIVGHSQGSLMPNYWVKFLGGAKRVDDYVGVTPLWDGTNLAALGSLAEINEAIATALGVPPLVYEVLEPYCASCRQFVRGSPFIERMSSGGGPAVASVDYTMIMTRNDELVVPYTSGWMPGADNHIVQRECALDQSEHLSIIFDPVTAGLIQNALDPKHAEPVPCTLVLPFVGAAGYEGG
jgi:pimeloyl-ACP methyl ester carboxylesterase